MLVFAGTQLWPDPRTLWVWALFERCIVHICHYGGKFVENRWNTLSSPCRTSADRLRGATSRSSITNTTVQGNNQSLSKKAKQTKRTKMMHRPQSRRSLQTQNNDNQINLNKSMQALLETEVGWWGRWRRWRRQTQFSLITSHGFPPPSPEMIVSLK